MRRALAGIVTFIAMVAFATGGCDPADDEATLTAADDESAETTTSTTTASKNANANSSAASTSTSLGYRGTAPVTEKPKPAAPTTTESTVKASSSGVADADRLVEFAKLDLVRRFGHDKDDIRLLGMESVTWPNAALGCPRYGKEYDEGDVPGYRIELQWKDVEYDYHGRSGSDPFLCEKLDG